MKRSSILLVCAAVFAFSTNLYANDEFEFPGGCPPVQQIKTLKIADAQQDGNHDWLFNTEVFTFQQKPWVVAYTDFAIKTDSKAEAMKLGQSSYDATQFDEPLDGLGVFCTYEGQDTNKLIIASPVEKNGIVKELK